MTATEPVEIEIFVEIPKGSRNKYEFDKATGTFHLDRVLYSSVHYPADYGFIPNTLAADGDPLDALVLVEEPTFSGCRIRTRPIGVLKMIDQEHEDFKILAVPIGDPRFEPIKDIGDLSPHWLKEIENFFDTYKTLEGKETAIVGWGGAIEASQIIASDQQRAKQKEKSTGVR